MNSHTGKRTRKTAIAALACVALLGGCGSDGDEGAAADPGARSSAASKLGASAAAPGELAALYADGPALIEGGRTAFEDTIASVEGYPVVVNAWGSWCGPCREEFPYFQQQAAEHLDEVAFLGVDTEDSPDAYETFIRDHPIPYPSVADPEGEYAEWTNPSLIGLPNTLFYDRDGELVYSHFGPYESEEDLATDIERYALSDEPSA
jgi:cytochrome c biogenesis protein CcmG, thiol:disulfide interchange protein DsbE